MDMKRALMLLWKGAIGVIAGVANWILAFMGMKEDSRWGRWSRRVIAFCWALLMILLTGNAMYSFTTMVYEQLERQFHWYSWYSPYSISTYLSVQEYDDGSFDVINLEGKHVLHRLAWVVTPLGEDSLACYSDGTRRGYFHIRTGEVIVKPRYTRAWCFSEGLAAVQDESVIKFINQQGEVVINTQVPYRSYCGDPIFHHGYCIMTGDHTKKIGLLNKQGGWALPPVYDDIVRVGEFYILTSGKQQSILFRSLEVCVPFMEAKFQILEDCISATMQDHTVRKYDLEGRLLDDFCIYQVDQLFYDSRELTYVSTRQYDSANNCISENPHESASAVPKLARCRAYQGEAEWYGLMSSSGKILTPPCYHRITAIDENLYYCEYNTLYGILLDGNGHPVN